MDQALVVAVPEVVFPLEDSAVYAEPSPPEEMPPVVEAPVAVEEPKQPVQSLAERGDAMLFESEALAGTPFDQAITIFNGLEQLDPGTPQHALHLGHALRCAGIELL